MAEYALNILSMSVSTPSAQMVYGEDRHIRKVHHEGPQVKSKAIDLVNDMISSAGYVHLG